MSEKHKSNPLRIDAAIVGPVVELRYASHGEAMQQLRILRERLSDHDKLAAVLRELVACQDIKDRLDSEYGKPVTHEVANLAADYECRKPWAWRAARAAIANGTTGRRATTGDSHAG